MSCAGPPEDTLLHRDRVSSLLQLASRQGKGLGSCRNYFLFSALFRADATRQQCSAPARSRATASLHAEATGLLPADGFLVAILAGPHRAAAQGEGQ